MAHQCLKCGETYADGSPQILKGCEGCKGTRFFYTDAPLAENERVELAEQAELDLERLALGKGAQGASPRKIPTKGELPLRSEQDHDWVAGGPTYLRGVVEDVVRRAGERKPVFRMGGRQAVDPEATRSVAEWAGDRAQPDGPVADLPGRSGDKGDDGLLEDLFSEDRETEWQKESGAQAATGPEPPGPVPDAGGAPEAEVVYKRTPRRIPKPVSLAGVAVDADEDPDLQEAAARARDEVAPKVTPPPRPSAASGVEESLYPEGQVPETVAVKDGGVYELDVKRLLEKSPLVVHKDGSYSLHLPSLMETLERKKQR